MTDHAGRGKSAQTPGDDLVPCGYVAPLGPRGFRLVEVWPGEWSEPIKCGLYRAALGSVRPYRALSYAWGSRRVKEEIWLNGGPVKVTVNLATALRILRRCRGKLLIWVDALCIDQVSDADKSHQVVFMKDIYATAEEVIVFLGDGHSHRIPAASAHRSSPDVTVFHNDEKDHEMVASFRSDLTASPAVIRSENKPSDVFCLLKLLADEATHPGEFKTFVRSLSEPTLQYLMEGLRSLMMNPWWQRMWVVQEFVVASKVSVQVGGVGLPWGLVEDAATQWTAMEQSGSARHLSFEHAKVLSWFARQVRALKSGREIIRSPRPFQGLLQLLREFAERKATDDRDKLYALLGLTDKATNTAIVPDYSLEVDEVYRQATTELLRSGIGFWPLIGDTSCKNRRSLPSWVLDWTTIHDEADKNRAKLMRSYWACRMWTAHVVSTEEDFFLHLARETKRPYFIKGHDSIFDIGSQVRDEVLHDYDFIESYRPDWKRVTDAVLTGKAAWLQLLLYHATQRDDELFGVVKHANWADGHASGSTTWTDERTGANLEVYDRNLKSLKDIIYSRYPDLENLMFSWALRVGMVRVVGPKLLTWGEPEAAYAVIREWLEITTGWERPTGKLDRDRRVRNFVSTVVGSLRRHGDKYRAVHEPDDGDDHMAWFAYQLSNKIFKDSDVPEELVSYCGTERKLQSDDETFTDVMRLATAGRVFFIADDGNMGLGPASLAEADLIYILPGGRTPFAVRGGRIIGDCFFDGVMTGDIKDIDSARPPLSIWNMLERFFAFKSSTDVETVRGIEFMDYCAEKYPRTLARGAAVEARETEDSPWSLLAIS